MAGRLLKHHIVCGMSGGVDSSVAALLLKRQGFRVTGLFMKNWDSLDESGICSTEGDYNDAQFVCDKLDIPLHQVSFVKEYWHDVFSNFLKEYENGTTPNPDILCNKLIKFDKFLNYAMKNFDAHALATGHYARTSGGYSVLTNPESVKKNGIALLKGLDANKDQTFFLSQISQNALQKTIFPLGELMKKEVKEIALRAGFERIVKKKESMGICFIGTRKFQSFIQEYLETASGNFVSVEDGTIMGDHKGCHLYTVGQRSNIGGQSQAWFICHKDSTTQTIYVAPGSHHPALFYQTMITEPLYWIRQSPPKLLEKKMFECDFRFQHVNVHPLVRCTVTVNDKQQGIISLQQPLRALTAGQFAVLYDEDECLGGARIMKTGPSLYELSKMCS
ncbi:mitochondrial tRNA-specific 2-thiouridylase 1-like [Saccoglossus kowalevskii]|uniref:tRNA-5-taurinomethyluridine 2-sulfurtransferase n=1 Tax=Saccoglossus kowalevskii TaxID=10224 RepID=A0ABM0GPU5_SACKO|nr:PREDICTED: mitochondrial tRNA-specific 2-thiouridylase 1-like [Saccoglossus kowalevskii]